MSAGASVEGELLKVLICQKINSSLNLSGRGLGSLRIFRKKWENSLSSNFDFGNKYFDSDYGQRWFWDDILVEIMVNIGEIWWKLGGSVIV